MSEGEYTINVTVTGLEDVERLRKADRTRYAPTDVFRGVFPANCLEY